MGPKRKKVELDGTLSDSADNWVLGPHWDR